MAEQIRLFEDATEVVAPVSTGNDPQTIEWSYSRRDLFERCLFWYYCQYYGATAGKAKIDPLKPQLRFLKSLSNCHLRAGDLLHLVIRTYFRRLNSGERWSETESLRWAEDLFKRDRSHSLNYLRPGRPGADNGHEVILAEFYYGWPEAEDIWQGSAIKLRKALTNFLMLPKFESFRAGAKHPQTLIEKTVRLREDHFRLRGQIDLAFPENDRVAVVDWKIGGAGGGEDSLQLLSYALVAMKEYNCSPEKIDLFRVHLSDGEITHWIVRAEEVQRAKARIIQDVQRMMTMDHYGREGARSAFTPCHQARVCRMCPYQDFCRKEVDVYA